MSTQKTGSRLVCITAPLDEGWLERLQHLSSEIRVEYWPARSGRFIPPDLWHEVEILYASFATPLPTPEQAPLLRWVQLYSAGPDSTLTTPLFQTSVAFTTASGVHAVNMAEYVFTMVLAWFHHLPLLFETQQRRQWPVGQERLSHFVPEELRGKTIAIVGYGSIGRQVARLAQAFRMRILAMQRGSDHRDRGFLFPDVGDPAGTLPDRYYTPAELRQMLGESDVVVIAVPLTQETRGLFDAAAFRAMKPGAFLINIARGDVCDDMALLHALQEKQIAGAALDVFHQEPLPPDHPLWHLPNVFISTHIAGLTTQYNVRAAMIFEENMRRYLAGEPLYNLVDKALGY